VKEAELIQRARRLEGQALAAIYDAHNEALYRYALRLLGDVLLAEDCVSETFTRFLNALSNGKGPRNYLQAYLFRIAHNWITDFYRRAAPETSDIDDEFGLAAEHDPEKTALENMQMRRTRAALQALTPDQRAVISLKYYEGWTNAEVAAMLDKPVGAVKSLQHRAVAALKRILVDEETENE
jgi:RNA polymerase sigma-70 factor (ECF subfamily)